MIDQRKDIIRDIARQYNISISTPTINTIANCMVQMKYAHRKHIIAEGEVCNYIYYISKGLVRQYYIRDGQEITEHLACEGEIVCCLESLFTRKPSFLQMHTIEPTILFAFPYDALQKLATQSQDICEVIFAFYKHIILLQQHKAEIIRFTSAKERYIRLCEYSPEIVRRTPAKYLASALQIRQETFSRIRKEQN
ncbi:MAG: cyclic nucleotide-binding domain-containing protein [Bacteroidaceae bacterium]|nr:cyclic nucleotide-binding domain-containing protein [Bacteroidaceae bacterium]